MRRTRSTTRRNWLDLPQDVMILIFSKLGIIEILSRAQFVCTFWQQVSRERQLFRSIYLPEEDPKFPSDGIAKILQEAVDRSCGELVEISIGDPWCKTKLLNYVVRKSKSLRVLRLTMFSGIYENGIMKALKKIPLLEEFELRKSVCDSCVLEELGRSCPRFKHLRLYDSSLPFKPYCKELELNIAKYLPRLQGLSFTQMWISNTGLQAILKRCSLLENLDFHQCCTSGLREDLLKKCLDKFRNVQLPRRVRLRR
ncbi:hypothetical protein ACHQM5_029260 [Ranunculus cassubicifolius]